MATLRMIRWFLSSRMISRGTAGFRASITISRGSAKYLMMSIFSPPSSRTIVFTRAPRAPTQAPTGSTLGSALVTAIFVR